MKPIRNEYVVEVVKQKDINYKSVNDYRSGNTILLTVTAILCIIFIMFKYV